MEKQDWLYITGIIVLFLAAALRYSDTLNEENFLQIVLFILGALFGGTAGYYIGKKA